MATFVVADGQTQAAIQGANVALGDLQQSTDANGHAELRVPAGASFEALVTAAGYFDQRVYGYAGGEDFQQDVGMGSSTAFDLLLGILGIVRDEGKGMLAVTLLDSAGGPLVGADLQISLPGQALAVLTQAPFALAGESTVPANGSGSIMYVNVDVGEATLTITTPAGESCGMTPGAGPAVPMSSVAGALSATTFVCL